MRLMELGVGISIVIILFGSGVLVGRQFPAHRFERIGQTPYLLDTATGSVCTMSFLELPPTSTGESSSAVKQYLDALPSKTTTPTPLCGVK